MSATENAIATAIRTGGTVDYCSSENPLNAPFIRVAELSAACRFLRDACENGTEGSLSGLSVIMDMLANELNSIGGTVDNISAEICRAVNGEAPFKRQELRIHNEQGGAA